ncbi:hypothetical protein BDN67DRAFT_986066 [Paxillus ammoniavirescens]|nr:hypothetical protein BDN67DRAFT_986066 [Paxillus ammoniavirescens]
MLHIMLSVNAPYRAVSIPQNPPPALMNHSPVPLNQFPGMPRNVIERHEVQRAWCAHHPPPCSPPPPAMQPQGFTPMLQPMQPQGFAPMMHPMQPYGGAPMMQPMQPPPPIWPQPAPPIPVHGNIFYEGAAQPRQQEGIHIHHFPPQQQQHHRMLMQKDVEIVEDYNGFNLGFHQNIINFQREAEEQQQQQLQREAEQAQREAAEECQRLQWVAEQERQAAEERQRLQRVAEQERRAAEEQQRLQWIAEQAQRQAAEEQH